MNIMTGCLSATAGSVKVDGHDIFEEPDRAKRLIGYLPEQPPLYMNETPLEYLKFVGEAKGLRGKELAGQIVSVVEQTRIGEVQNRLISKLSKGYRQRVGIAQALLGNPRVVILDEPTVGLDPLQIIEIRDLIRQLGKEHTVILSSHILSEVQAICEKVLIIAKGRMAAFDAPENLEKLLLSSNTVSFTAEAEREEIEGILEKIEGVCGWQMKGGDGCAYVEAKIAYGELTDICRAVFMAFAERKRTLLELTSKKANLEDIFIELTESGGLEKKPPGRWDEGGQTPEGRAEEGGRKKEEMRKDEIRKDEIRESEVEEK